MFAYHLDLALRSLKRNKVLTTLMVLALALGIGASITTLTVLRLLSGDPLPQKSARLYYPQLDPNDKDGYVAGESKPPPTMTYVDAMSLLHARRATRQAVMALTQAKIVPQQANAHPFFSDGVMTTADFFAMFDARFQYGSGWTAEDDERGAPRVVIAGFLNDKLFGGADSVGRTIRLNDHDFRVAGVLEPWAPQPRFYTQGLGGRSYGDGDAVFLPLKTARDLKMSPQDTECYAEVPDFTHVETAPCMWLGFWVELDDAAAVASYRAFLDGYVRQQIATGRFERSDTRLLDLMAWLRERQVVPDDVRLQVYMAFGFLLICVVNTVGLLLAKCLRRSQEIGVRRALGATRGEIFNQFMVEAGIVGLVGGMLGLGFAELGLFGIRHQPAEYAGLARLDAGMFALTFAVALVASLVAGLLPAWRACVLAPAPQLKAA
ncbi:ABC transporter permease [Dyella sp.]|jgi:putative ABC transport system permease protein|uniref:ABC transporter permease n=1 Tax=Dyella sp. TaxID=1869338 RepID=UPI002D7767A0|nr:ABC transporter permease [Dyella sp.]HET6431738.1 ABC transporter permease [Dyella sp.]